MTFKASGFKMKRGVTLIEALVVFAVLGVLVALIMPAVQIARESARKVHCANNNKQLGLASHNFESKHKHLPPWVLVGQQQMTTAHFLILPFVEQLPLYTQASGYSSRIRTSSVAAYACPSDLSLSGGKFTGSALTTYPGRASSADGDYGGTSYAINANAASITFQVGHPVRPDGTFARITDGLSQTILFAERMAFAHGEHYPSSLPPNLNEGSFTFAIWTRAGKNASNIWQDGAASTEEFPTPSMRPRSRQAEGYSWWDSPVFDAPYRNTEVSSRGPGPRSDPEFRNGWNGVKNPGGIQSGARVGSTDYRRLQALHNAVMIAALTDGSVRSISASIDPLVFQRACNPFDGHRIAFE